jgi:hypothetical protein
VGSRPVPSMRSAARRPRRRTRAGLLAAIVLAVPLLAIPTSVAAEPGAPWDGTPISAGLGPTYGEAWCQPPDPGTSIAALQGPPLAVIPYEAIRCTVEDILAEGVAAGIPTRASFDVNTLTDTGREQLAIVVNALETPEQQRDYERWTQIRALLTTDPGAAQDLLASFGEDVKLPIFIEANIHGGEREGTDAMLQVLRDLVTTPYGEHPVVDSVLDHTILIVIPSQNPDGRYLGTRANSNGFDMNRDLLVQSQPEIRANIRLQQEWLAPVMLAMHGYVNPTLIDGLTKPHNPGLEYDIFAGWNQRRIFENEADFRVIGQNLSLPVNMYNADGGALTGIVASPNGAVQSGTTVTITTTAANHGLEVGDTVTLTTIGVFAYTGRFEITSVPAPNKFTYELGVTGLAPSGGGAVFAGTPATAEGWDDWGPFYTQTYSAFFGVDGSTLEMCSNAACGGRLGSKTAQYLGFYSSADFWLTNRADILHDQLTVAERNVTNAPRVACCDDPLLIERGFDAENHDWMVPYPKAFVIPNGSSPGGKPLAFDDGQRSPSEANRLAQWLLDNGVEVERTTKDYGYAGQTLAKGSYVVYLDQFMRGFAYTALSRGQDISDRITQLYAPPGAWSHGQLWGADTIEVPASATFAPKIEPIAAVAPLQGGVRGGGSAAWYALPLRGVGETRAVLDLLRDGIDGEIAEASFASASAGTLPAGSVLFENTPANVTALTAAGLEAGVWFERVQAAAKPATTQLDEAPRIGVLTTAGAPTINDTFHSLKRIFGSDVEFISGVAGSNSLQTAPDDPLADIDVLYNTGQLWPGTVQVAGAATSTTTSGASQPFGTSVTRFNTTAAHGLTVGDQVTTFGISAAGAVVPGYNGTFTVTLVESATRFQADVGVSGLPNAGGGFVSSSVLNATAQGRLRDFLARGGGYLATSASANGFTFLSVGSGLVDAFSQGSASAGGGIARFENSGGAASPITGAYPATDFWYLPSNVTYFSAVPSDAVIDARYPDDASEGPLGPTELFVTGLWRSRDSATSVAAVGAPVIVHGETGADSRYLGFATNPFSRGDFERAWPLIATAALWSNLTDEP